MPTRRSLAVPLALALMLALSAAGCGDGSASGGADEPANAHMPGADRPPVTLGTRTSSEQILLGQLYKRALEAKGYKVALKQNIGSTEIADTALRSGQIDLYPEYVGSFNRAVARQPHGLSERGRRVRRRPGVRPRAGLHAAAADAVHGRPTRSP